MANIRQFIAILLVGVISIQLDCILADSICRPDWIGDGFCDSGCNKQRYNFDDGDCCEETCKSRPRVFDCDLYGYDCKPQSIAPTSTTHPPTTTLPSTSSTQTPTERPTTQSSQPTTAISVPDWFTETEICVVWRPDGSSGLQCGDGVANVEFCAPTGEMTTYYLDDTDDRQGGCRIQWGIRYVNKNTIELVYSI